MENVTPNPRNQGTGGSSLAGPPEKKWKNGKSGVFLNFSGVYATASKVKAFSCNLKSKFFQHNLPFFSNFADTLPHTFPQSKKIFGVEKNKVSFFPLIIQANSFPSHLNLPAISLSPYSAVQKKAIHRLQKFRRSDCTSYTFVLPISYPNPGSQPS